MKLLKHSYEYIFKNKFAPHPEIMKYNWQNYVYEISNKKENSQNEKATEKNKTTTISESTELAPIDYEIKDITPRKHLFRRK